MRRFSSWVSRTSAFAFLRGRVTAVFIRLIRKTCPDFRDSMSKIQFSWQGPINSSLVLLRAGWRTPDSRLHSVTAQSVASLRKRLSTAVGEDWKNFFPIRIP